MINSTDLKNGATFLKNGKPYKVVKYSFIKMGRGGATVKVVARNIETGTTENLSFSSNVKVEAVTTTKKNLQYLYKDGSTAFFMDSTSYEQIEIPLSLIKEEIQFIKEGESVNILFWDDSSTSLGVGKPLSVEIPLKATLKVIDTDPGVRGNSASNVYKAAKLENGLEVKVPLFINIGEKIVVDTRNGEYVERAK